MDYPPELNLALAHINKQYNDNSIMRLGDDDIKPCPAISTGAFSLDVILGVGGLPKGRIVELYGLESSGKSTLSLSVIAEAQKQGGIAAYIDAEHTFDAVYAKLLGVEVDDLLLAQPDHGEAALDIAEKLVRTNAISVIVIDSVAALIPKAELEAGMSEQQMGLQARMMSKGLKKLQAPTHDAGCLIIFINQIRQKIGVMYGNPETTPGGLALKFAASVRIKLRKKEDIKDKDGDVIGIRIVAQVLKNKVAIPIKMAEFDLIYDHGIDSIGCIFDVAADHGIIKRSGAWYSYNDQQIGQGRPNAVQFLRDDLDLLDEIKEQVVGDGKQT